MSTITVKPIRNSWKCYGYVVSFFMLCIHDGGGHYVANQVEPSTPLDQQHSTKHSTNVNSEYSTSLIQQHTTNGSSECNTPSVQHGTSNTYSKPLQKC